MTDKIDQNKTINPVPISAQVGSHGKIKEKDAVCKSISFQGKVF